MKKFMVEVTQHAYREGFYELEAPDEDAAYVLAGDIKLSDPRIKWGEFSESGAHYAKPQDIYVTEAKE